MTRPIQYNDEISTGEIWELTLQWVSTNRGRIRQFAAPYFRHMAADSDDIYQIYVTKVRPVICYN